MFITKGSSSYGKGIASNLVTEEERVKYNSGGRVRAAEGYGPYSWMPNNPIRTVAKIRLYFGRSGGSLGTNGSVSFMFDRKGEFIFPLGDHDVDDELNEEEFDMETNLTCPNCEAFVLVYRKKEIQGRFNV